MGSNQSTAELVEVHFNDALYIVEMPKEKFKCKDVVNEIWKQFALDQGFKK